MLLLTSDTAGWTSSSTPFRTCHGASTSQASPSQPHRVRQRGRQSSSCRCKLADDDAPDVSAGNRLGPFLKKKQRIVQQSLEDLGMEMVELRMEDATSMPAEPAYRLSNLVQDISMGGKTMQPRPVLVLEIGRGSVGRTHTELADLAKRYVEAGADALAVQTCNDDGTTSLGDLFAAVKAVKAPVLQSDWFLHPMQVVDAKQAGAAGVLGVIANVLGKGTPLVSSFTAAIGLDAPVEVVNADEVKVLDQLQVPFYGINLSVGLSLSLPGFRSDIASGLLDKLPYGVASMVGIRSIDEGRRARAAGAGCLLVKEAMLQEAGAKGLRHLLQELLYATSGDD